MSETPTGMKLRNVHLQLETAIRRVLQVIGDQRPDWLDGWEVPLLERLVEEEEQAYLLSLRERQSNAQDQP